jgi:hypothetical protein
VTILRSYPDYGKAPPEYVASLMSAIERYPLEVIAQLVDPRKGVPGRCKYLPTVADVVELGDRFEAGLREREDRKARYEAREQRLRLPAPPHDDANDLEYRKETVIRELGYDPLYVSGGKKAWCFDPEKPPVNAPWHDPEELRKSAERLAKLQPWPVT